METFIGFQAPGLGPYRPAADEPVVLVRRRPSVLDARPAGERVLAS